MYVTPWKIYIHVIRKYFKYMFFIPGNTILYIYVWKFIQLTLGIPAYFKAFFFFRNDVKSNKTNANKHSDINMHKCAQYILTCKINRIYWILKLRRHYRSQQVKGWNTNHITWFLKYGTIIVNGKWTGKGNNSCHLYANLLR